MKSFTSKLRVYEKWKLLFLSTLGVSLFFSLLWWVGFERLLSIFSTVEISWLVLSILLGFIVYPVRAWRWRILLTPIKNPIKFPTIFWVSVAGYMFNVVIPVRVGEPLRAALLSGKEGLDFLGCLSSVLVERILDLIFVAGLVAITLILLPIQVRLPLWVSSGLVLTGIIASLMLILLIFSIRWEGKILSILKKISSFLPATNKLKVKILQWFSSIICGAKSLTYNLRTTLMVIVSTLIVWITNFFALFFLFMAFRFTLPILLMILIYGLVTLILILPAPPGYTGTYETFWLLVFLCVGLSETDIVLALGVANHVIMLLTSLFLGLLGLSWLGLSFTEILKKGKKMFKNTYWKV